MFAVKMIAKSRCSVSGFEAKVRMRLTLIIYSRISLEFYWLGQCPLDNVKMFLLK